MKEIAGEVEFLGSRRALVVSTPGRAKIAGTVVEMIGKRCVGLFPEAVSQVPIELARAGRKHAAELEADCIVAIGGGASVGLAKGIAYEYKVPIINIPTTYSGSEVTGFCGMTIEGVKRMHISLNMLAHTLIYDPELSVGLPVAVSAASAMNALAHCVDAVYTSTVNPVVAIAAAEGARCVADSVTTVVGDPGNLEARGALLYGGYLAGVALTGGFALQHGLAHVLGGTFHVEHGMAHSLTLPYVTAFNSYYAADKLAPIAEAMKTDVSDLGGVIYDLRKELGLPAGLREIGFKRADLDKLADITVETDNKDNPVVVTKENISTIVEAMWYGERPPRKIS